jgi:GTP diphosphokinase / guanosine-3',5'-bis(diphosphate) 3'-diphosphatase
VIIKSTTELRGGHFLPDNISLILKALKFSAEKHRDQRRKGEPALPYINHPIEVAHVLSTIGNVSDIVTIIGALLHDTIEDTDATPEEIGTNFGEEVLALVLEVSDDKGLPKQERKLKQIRMAPYLSARAKELKLADKTCNIRDIVNYPPQDWSRQRKMEYLDWAKSVILGLRGSNAQMEKHFDDVLSAAFKKMKQETA